MCNIRAIYTPYKRIEVRKQTGLSLSRQNTNFLASACDELQTILSPTHWSANEVHNFQNRVLKKLFPRLQFELKKLL